MAFATTTDIGARLETTLAGAELDHAELLLELVPSVIAEAVDKDDAWITSVEADPPTILRFIAIEAVCRAMASPQGLQSATEQLGAYTRTEQYRREISSHLMLTDREERLARRSVYGTNSGSSKAETVIDELVPS